MLLDDLTLTPEQRLIMAIIQSGIAERDWEYVLGTTFEHHADMLNLDVALLRENILSLFSSRDLFSAYKEKYVNKNRTVSAEKKKYE